MFKIFGKLVIIVVKHITTHILINIVAQDTKLLKCK
jgi:hypothetical protein